MTEFLSITLGLTKFKPPAGRHIAGRTPEGNPQRKPPSPHAGIRGRLVQQKTADAKYESLLTGRWLTARQVNDALNIVGAHTTLRRLEKRGKVKRDPVIVQNYRGRPEDLWTWHE